MADRREKGERGQASVELVGVVLLVAVLLAAAIAAADALGARSGIGDIVRRQMGRAICVVSGGGATCEADRQPCLVRSDANQRRVGLDLLVMRYGRTKSMVVEELSDGSFRVTDVQDVEAGLALTQGAHFDMKLGRRKLHAGRELQAAVLGHLGDSDTWTLRSWREVDELVTALKQGRPHRSPDTQADERGWSVSLSGTASTGALGVGVTLSAKDVYGSRVDRAGRRTVYVRPSRDVQGTLTLSALEGRAAAGGTELYGVTLDRAGTPVELQVLRSGSYGASVDLPQNAQAARQLLGVAAPGAGREYAVETRLALTSEADRRLAATFIGQVVHPDVIHTGAPVDVSRALGRRLAEAGMADARVYAVDEGGAAIGGRVGANGFGVGAEIGVGETRKARLISAASRGPDGVWYRRDDCLRRR